MSAEFQTLTQVMDQRVEGDAFRIVCQLGYPNGGLLKCHRCNKERVLDLEAVIKLLMKSWPKLCSDCQKPADLISI